MTTTTTTATLRKVGRIFATEDMRFVVSRQRDGYFMLDRTTRDEFFITETRAGMIAEAQRQIREILASETADETPQIRMIRADMIWKHKHDHLYGCSQSCQCCGREVSDNAVGIVIAEGGHSIVHPEDAPLIIADAGYMGWFPVGSKCANVIPDEYLTR